MDRTFILLGAVAAGLAVALGAFGAHGLESRVTPARLQTFETGVRYHMYHAFALIAVAWAVSVYGSSGLLVAAGWCFVVGIIVFAGSLYVLVLTDTPWLGAITPFGGVAFIVGWALLAWSVWRG